MSLESYRKKLQEFKRIRELASHGPWIFMFLSKEYFKKELIAGKDKDLVVGATIGVSFYDEQFITTSANNWTKLITDLETALDFIEDRRRSVVKSGGPYEDALLKPFNDFEDKITSGGNE